MGSGEVTVFGVGPTNSTRQIEMIARVATHRQSTTNKKEEVGEKSNWLLRAPSISDNLGCWGSNKGDLDRQDRSEKKPVRSPPRGNLMWK